MGLSGIKMKTQKDVSSLQPAIKWCEEFTWPSEMSYTSGF